MVSVFCEFFFQVVWLVCEEANCFFFVFCINLFLLFQFQVVGMVCEG